MAQTLDEVKATVLKLSARDRGELIRVLIDSVDDAPLDRPETVAREWDNEISRRLDDLDAGRFSSVSEDEVFARIGQKLKKSGA